MVTVSNGAVEFSFFRPQAQGVHVVGEFNDWRTDQLPMTRNENGYWTLKLQLAPGVFKFRYLADGTWYTDYAAFGVDPGPFGYDSVLHVPAPRLTVAAPVEAPAPATAAA